MAKHNLGRRERPTPRRHHFRRRRQTLAWRQAHAPQRGEDHRKDLAGRRLNEPDGPRQREKRSAGGASGQRPNHLGVDRDGGADCPSVPSGRTGSVESVVGGFFGGSARVRGRSTLRAVSFGCGRRLIGFGVFSSGTIGAASGNSSAITPGSLGRLSDSTHRKKVCLSSSIAAHPARPTLADTAIATNASRPARARVDIVVTRRVPGSLVGLWRRTGVAPAWFPCG
jgi:hypothetical protein